MINLSAIHSGLRKVEQGVEPNRFSLGSSFLVTLVLSWLFAVGLLESLGDKMPLSALTNKFRITRSDEGSYLNILDDGRKFWILAGDYENARRAIPTNDMRNYSGDFTSRFSKDTALRLLEAEKERLKNGYPNVSFKIVEDPDYTSLIFPVLIIAGIAIFVLTKFIS